MHGVCVCVHGVCVGWLWLWCRCFGLKLYRHFAITLLFLFTLLLLLLLLIALVDVDHPGANDQGSLALNYRRSWSLGLSLGRGARLARWVRGERDDGDRLRILRVLAAGIDQDL